MGKFAGIIGDIAREEEEQRARAAGITAPAIAPDAMGRAMAVADQRKLPVGVVADNLADYDEQDRLAGISDAASASPVLARWLGDPNHVAVAADDTGILKSISTRFNSGLLSAKQSMPWLPLPQGAIDLQRAREEAVRRGPEARASENPGWFTELVSKFGAGWYQGRQAGSVTFDRFNPVRVNEQVARGLGYTSADDANAAMLGATVGEAGRQAAAVDRTSTETQAGLDAIAAADATGSWGAVGKAVWDNPRVVMSVTAQSLGATAPQLTISAAMPASRIMQAITAGAGSYTAEQGFTVLDVMGDAGVDTTDAGQVTAFLRNKQAMAAAREKAQLRGVAVATFDALTAGFAGRLLANSRRSIASVGGRVAGEGLAQAAGGAAGEASAQLLSEGEISSRSDILLEAAAEVPTFIAEGRGQIAEARRAALANADRFDAAQEQKSITDLVNLAAQSKTKQRAATRFEALVRDMTSEGEDTVYLSAEGARTLFQSANTEGDGQADAAGLDGLVDAESLRDAIATGSEVAIPLERYLSMVSPEQHAGIADQVRLQAGGQHDVPAVSSDEIQAAITAGLAEAQQQVERENGPAGQVYDDIYGQLLTKQDEVLARQNASVVQAVYRNLAARVGTDAWTLYNQFRVVIPGAVTDTRGKRRDVDIDLDPVLDALRTGKLPTDREIYGESMASALHAAGGLRDSGGELANMDAAKLRPGLVNNLAGMTMDDALVWAYQEGFISEAPTQFREEYSDDAPDINTFLDMLAADLGGNPVYRPDAMNAERASFRERAEALGEELDARGINLAEVDNVTAREALGYVGRTLNQSAGPQEFTATTKGGTFRLTDERAPAGADFSEFGEVRIIEAFDGDEKVGSLLYANDGTPPTIEVDASHRRKGIGTAMLKLAKQQGGILGERSSGMRRDGGRPTYRTDDGQAFREGADEGAVTIERAPRTLSQSAHTETPEFQAWFGDSKVVDAEGRPLVVYHGTDASFDSFSSDALGNATRANSAREGFFFTTDPALASDYTAVGDYRDSDMDMYGASFNEWESARQGAQVYPAYLSIQNPKVIDYQGEEYREVSFAQVLQQAKAEGHDGAVFRNARDAAFATYDQPSDIYVAFKPEQIKSATANSGAFDPNNPSILQQQDRGQVTFLGEDGARVFNIDLFAGMDASTFMHEMGHVYLEVLNDLATRDGAVQQVVDDMATLNAWLGREAGQPITTEQHEQFARGWEAYLREGKAPSSALRRVFAAFKVWLTALYRNARALNVDLTDDVRGVMDRIVASDAEIEEARAGQFQEALIADGLAVGMSPEEFDRYNAAVQVARADAEAAVAAEVLLAQRREQRAWYNREKRAVAEQVRAELRELPVYRTQRILRTGKLPDGSEAPDVLRVKLNKDDLLDKFGQSFLRNLIGMYSVEGGVRAEEAAALFGFGSGREMIDQLVSAPRLSEATAAETESRMRDRYPDPMTDGTLPDRAMVAAHRDRQADVMVREIRALEAHVVGRAASDGAVFKSLAKSMIGQKKLRHLQPATYRAAEAKAGREAFQAAAKQDWPAALAARRRQLLNFELFREAVRARDEAARAAKYLAKFGETKTRQRLGKAGHDYLDQVDALLDRFDFRKITDKASDRRASLRAWLQKMEAAGIDVNLPEKLVDEAFRMPFRELTMADLLAVRDAVKAIDHLARLKGKLLLAGEQRDAEAVDAAMAASLEDSHKARPITTGDRSKMDAVRQAFMQGRVLQATANDIARELDGYVDQGAIWTNTVGVMRDAVNNRLNPALQQSQDELAAIYVKHYTPEEIRAFSERDPLPEVGGDLWSKSRILSLALNWGNAGNREAILTQAKGKLTPDQVGLILARLGPKDWQFVQDVWSLIDAQWPAIAEAQRRRTGLAPEKVKADPFTVVTSDGRTLDIPGGYYPLKYEADSVKSMKEEADDFYNAIRTGKTAKAATKNGHTIERVGSGGRTVRLDTGVIQQHLRDVLRDVHLGDAVNYVHTVLNGQQFREAVDTTGMQEYRQSLEVWLKDSASGEIGPRVWHERAMRSVRQNFTASVLTWKASSALLQVTGVIPTSVVLGHRNALAGIQQYLRRPVAMSRYVRNASPFMDARLRTHIEVVQTVMDAEAGRFAAGKAAMIRYGYWMIARVQGMVDTVTWLAAEQAGMSKFDGDVARARAFADDVVTRAQGSGEFIDKSAMQRGTLGDNVRQSEWIKATTALQGYMIAKGNLAYEQTRKTNFRDTRQAMKWAADMVMLFSVEGLITAAISGKLPDDDDEDGLADDWLAFLAGDAAGSIFGVFPGGGVMVSEFRGYDAGGVLANAWGAYADLTQQIAQGEMDRGVVKAAVTAAGATVGLPSSQINKTLDAIAARMDGRDVSPYEYLTGPKKE